MYLYVSGRRLLLVYMCLARFVFKGSLHGKLEQTFIFSLKYLVKSKTFQKSRNILDSIIPC
jgi:hypothetical protein